MDFIFGLLSDSLVAIITFFGGLIIALLKKHSSHNKVRSVLRFENTDQLDLCCFTANTGVYDENELVTLGYVFEYMAVGELRAFFRKNYKNEKMKVNMSKEYITTPRDSLHQNLVLIGGPFHNSITGNLVMNPKYNMPFRFDADANLIYDGPAGHQEFHPELSDSSSRYYEHDYALILNIPNPLNPSKRILALMGCRSVGCYGAAYYVTHHLKDMKKMIRSKDYAIVIKVIGDEENIICEPELMWHCPLELSKQKTPAPAKFL